MTPHQWRQELSLLLESEDDAEHLYLLPPREDRLGVMSSEEAVQHDREVL